MSRANSSLYPCCLSLCLNISMGFDGKQAPRKGPKCPCISTMGQLIDLPCSIYSKAIFDGLLGLIITPRLKVFVNFSLQWPSYFLGQCPHVSNVIRPHHYNCLGTPSQIVNARGHSADKILLLNRQQCSKMSLNKD